MLTFLRKIRKSLIDSGSTQKYLLYAIGEIALVTIGILIALQINAIKTSKDYSVLEDNFFRNVQEEMAKDTARLTLLTNFYQVRKDNAIWFLKYIRHPKLQHEIDDLDVFNKLEPLYFTYEEEVQNSSTFESAKFSGSFPHFKNQELLRIIAKYYSDLGYKNSCLKGSKEWVTQNLEPVMKNLPSLDHVITDESNISMPLEIDFTENYKLIAQIGDSRENNFPIEDLLRNTKFEWFVDGEMGRSIFTLVVLKNQMDQANEILTEISNTLGK